MRKMETIEDFYKKNSIGRLRISAVTLDISMYLSWILLLATMLFGQLAARFKGIILLFVS